MTEVVISFSPFDEKLVQPIIQGLHERYPNIYLARPLGVRPEFWGRNDVQKGIVVKHIRAADCVIVCWSLSSLGDKHVESDARIAKELGKLIPVLINPLMPDHFPKDLRPADAANLGTWNCDYDDEKWRNFHEVVERKIAEVQAKQGKAQVPDKRVGEFLSSADWHKVEELAKLGQAQAPKKMDVDFLVSSPGRRIYSTKTEPDKATPGQNVDDGKKQGKKVFICYRRDDSAGSAGRVKDRLEREFGADLLFMDVDAIPYGENFVKYLRDGVSKCDVLLAVIGPKWLTLRDKQRKRRVDDQNDYVRIEIGTALQRNIPVVPLLLDGAQMPKANELPEDLQELAVRNALEVRHNSFHSDLDRLVSQLKRE